MSTHLLRAGPRYRLLVATAAASYVFLACSSSPDAAREDPSTTLVTEATASSAVDATTIADPATTVATSRASTTSLAEPDPARFASSGPYGVGVTTRELPTGNQVEIWYPSETASDRSTDRYQLRSFVPDAFAALVTEDVDDGYEFLAQRDASPSSDGPFPVILFSHGFASFRLQSSDLTRHLASWGFVVAAPDHPSRNLASQLGDPVDNAPGAIDDLRSTRTLVEAAATDGLLSGAIDPTQLVLVGHSAGGATVLEMGADTGVLGYIALAVGAEGDDLPDRPSLFMSGDLDGIVDPERSADAFRRAPSPSWHWSIEGAGHLVFTDLCRIGAGDGGLVALAEAAGLDRLVPDNLRRLATDGCFEPNRPVVEIWPVVRHATTAFARSLSGDVDVVGALDTNPITSVAVAVSANTGP